MTRNFFLFVFASAISHQNYLTHAYLQDVVIRLSLQDQRRSTKSSAAQAFVLAVNLSGVAWLPGVVVETALARQRLASSCHAHSRKAKLA